MSVPFNVIDEIIQSEELQIISKYRPYFAHEHEIMAYANDAAYDLSLIYSFSEAMNFLKDSNKTDAPSRFIKLYTKLFNLNEKFGNRKVLNLFYKYLYWYLEHYLKRSN